MPEPADYVPHDQARYDAAFAALSKATNQGQRLVAADAARKAGCDPMDLVEALRRAPQAAPQEAPEPARTPPVGPPRQSFVDQLRNTRPRS